MSSKMSLEEKVLEYWYVLEFLGQDKYPQKELIDASNAAKSLKERLIKRERGYKSIFDFFEVNPRNDLYEVIKREAELCHMKKWGNITIYIGKVKREACIKCITERLPFENEKDERPERNFDDIACASLQLTPEGKYIEHSLSLSTIIWAMKQIKTRTKRVADCLEEMAYNAAIEDMENIFFPKKNKQEFSDINCRHIGETNEQDIRQPESDFVDSMQEFELDAVSITVFEKIYNYIEKEYLRDSVEQIEGEKPYELIIGISFQMFIDNNTRIKEEDDNYLGLSHDYFSDDLKMILNQVRRGDKNIPEHVLDYISSTYKASIGSDGKRRIDLLCPSDRNAFEGQVQEILNVRNAPMGKWPSRYMPAFMQQMAINLAIKKGTSSLFGEMGSSSL